MTSPGVQPIALWVVPVADLAGVARHVLDALSHGIPGWRAVLLCPPGPLAERAAQTGIAVLTGPVSPHDGLRASVAEVRRVTRALRPRVVHSHLSFADLAVALGTVGSASRVVTTEHGIAADDLVYHGTRTRSAIRAEAHHVRLQRVDALIAVSASTLHVVRQKWRPSRRVHTVVIPNGLDPVKHPERQPGLHIVSLARLAPEKGLSDLLTSFAVLAERESHARLTLAGTGPLEDSLRSDILRLGIAGRVSLPGHVDPRQLLADGDVLAQLSVWENCSYSLLDAQAHGLGVVATPVGGNPELLPQRCLVARNDHTTVAEALRAQGLDLPSRPALTGWPTVADMCTAIATVYAEVLR